MAVYHQSASVCGYNDDGGPQLRHVLYIMVALEIRSKGKFKMIVFCASASMTTTRYHPGNSILEKYHTIYSAEKYIGNNRVTLAGTHTNTPPWKAHTHKGTTGSQMQSGCLTDYKQCETSQGCHAASHSMVNIVMLLFLPLFLSAFSAHCLAFSLLLTHRLGRTLKFIYRTVCLYLNWPVTVTNYTAAVVLNSSQYHTVYTCILYMKLFLIEGNLATFWSRASGWTPCSGSHSIKKYTACPVHSSIIFCGTLYGDFSSARKENMGHTPTNPYLLLSPACFSFVVWHGWSHIDFQLFPPLCMWCKSLFSLCVFERSRLEPPFDSTHQS